jgi:hypothetical protein
MVKTYWRISFEVAGGLAEGTEMDTSVHPPQVFRLHHRFDGWLGDEIIECFPCYLVTERVAKMLDGSGLSGFELDDVETSKSPEFDEMYPGRQLPRFRWLKITTTEPNETDFRLTQDARLELSDAALALLRHARLDQANIERA